MLVIGLVVTASVAWLIAVIVSHGTSLVCLGIVCWVLVYSLWKWGDRKSTTRPFWWTVLRKIITLVAAALALITGALALAITAELHFQSQEEQQNEKQVSIEKNKVGIEKNKVGIGMTIYDVLPLLHVYGIAYIDASAVVDVNKVGYYSPDRFRLGQTDDGTFYLSGYWATKPVSGNLTRSQDHERAEKERVLENLTEFQAAEVINQKMSGGYEWHWNYTFPDGPLTSSFTVTFGRDGRVNDITDVQVTDLLNDRA